MQTRKPFGGPGHAFIQGSPGVAFPGVIRPGAETRQESQSGKQNRPTPANGLGRFCPLGILDAPLPRALPGRRG